MKHASWLFGCAAAALAACSSGSNIVNTGGSGGGGASTSSSSSSSSTTTSSGAMPCTDVSQCNAMTTECQKPTCTGGFCQVDYTAMGTAVAAQTAGDCQKVVCDGQGNTTSVPDDGDTPDDKNDCTNDTCASGVPTSTNKPKSTACAQGGGTLCTADGKCVECLSSSDCPSQVCTANACVSAQCGDQVKNGAESDVDCGGGTCPKCGPGKHCGGNADCISATCTAGTCAATCTDGLVDGTETDIDCGGASCPKCIGGLGCGTDADCVSGRCTNNKCADVLLISQVQSRGDNGGNDELIELYNPMTIPVTFDASWVLKARSALGGVAMCAQNSLAQRFAGAGQVIPPHGHILFVNNTVPSYNGPTPGDGTYTIGIPDAASVVLLHGNDVIDALCFYYDAITQEGLTQCSAAYICEGTPLSNPHNNTASTNSDVSLERKPGGGGGNGQDTDDNSADFAVSNTPGAHNLASAPVP